MPLLVSRGLDDAGFAHAFPTRDADDAELLRALGSDRIVQVHQVHGSAAALASAVAAGGRVEADAVVARASEGRAAVGVRVADCVPVLVADEATGDTAAIHAGWRGVEAGVVGAAVALLTARGARDGLIAAIGPCIGPCCFEVDRDVGDRIGFVVREVRAKAYVDLRAAVRAQLDACGVARVDDVPGCTRHEPERFHSFRRDGAHSGRMLAAIVTRL